MERMDGADGISSSAEMNHFKSPLVMKPEWLCLASIDDLRLLFE